MGPQDILYPGTKLYGVGQHYFITKKSRIRTRALGALTGVSSGPLTIILRINQIHLAHLMMYRSFTSSTSWCTMMMYHVWYLFLGRSQLIKAQAFIIFKTEIVSQAKFHDLSFWSRSSILLWPFVLLSATFGIFCVCVCVCVCVCERVLLSNSITLSGAKRVRGLLASSSQLLDTRTTRASL